MAAASSVIAPERTLVTTRVFDAPRALVYRAWTDPKQFARWFPPEGFTTAACELDVRPGGAVRIDFQAPAGPPSFQMSASASRSFPRSGIRRCRSC